MLIRDEKGASMVEVMIAIVVFMIIMVGGLNYFVQPHSAIVKQRLKRRAAAAAQTRMESLLKLDFTHIIIDSNEVDTAVSLGAVTGLRSTTITFIDDDDDGQGTADADGDTVDYKSILVSLSWSGGGNKQVSFTTTVSRYGL